MKRLFLLALLGAALSTLNGCAMSDEDKDFYGRGWIRPTDLDHPYPQHSGTPKDATATTPTNAAPDAAGVTPPSTTADPAHDSAWDVVGGRPQ